MKNMMKIMLVVSMITVGMVNAMASRLSRVGQGLKNVRFNSTAAGEQAGFSPKGLNTQETAKVLAREAEENTARKAAEAAKQVDGAAYSEAGWDGLTGRIGNFFRTGKNTGLITDAQVGQQEINTGIMQNLKNAAANENLQAAGIVTAGAAGIAAGANMVMNGDQNQTSQENSNNQSLRNWQLFDLGLSKGTQKQPLTESVIEQPVDYIQQGLQAITDQTDMNNKQIAALQAMEQTADVKDQIQDLEVQNIALMAQADDVMEGANRENVQDRQLEHYRNYTGRYQRGKDFLYDNAGVYFSRLGNGLSNYFDSARNSLSNVWQGFTSLGIRDRFNMIVEGMKSVASSTADLPVGAARQLAAAYKAMMAKIKRNKKTVEVTPTVVTLAETETTPEVVTMPEMSQEEPLYNVVNSGV